MYFKLNVSWVNLVPDFLGFLNVNGFQQLFMGSIFSNLPERITWL